MDPDKIVSEIDNLVETGVTVEDACSVVGKDQNKTPSAIRNLYYRNGGGGRNLGNRALTPNQEREVLHSVIAISQVWWWFFFVFLFFCFFVFLFFCFFCFFVFLFCFFVLFFVFCFILFFF